jgi:hypothetical protein
VPSCGRASLTLDPSLHPGRLCTLILHLSARTLSTTRVGNPLFSAPQTALRGLRSRSHMPCLLNPPSPSITPTWGLTSSFFLPSHFVSDSYCILLPSRADPPEAGRSRGDGAGINLILDPQDASFLTDPANPTIVMGADITHPPPGTMALRRLLRWSEVSTRMQSSMPLGWVSVVPTGGHRGPGEHLCSPIRAIQRRNSPSASCPIAMASLRVNLKRCSARSPPSIRSMHASPSYTRPPKCLHATQLQPYHHAHCCWQRAQIRLFPRGLRRRMRPATSQPELSAGNCHRYGPVEWDLYLCSHQGILGTNKRAHYNILLDENNFTTGGIQSLSYALCHVYARCTRSVSIPAPVFTHITCVRVPRTTMIRRRARSSSQPRRTSYRRSRARLRVALAIQVCGWRGSSKRTSR